MSRPRVAVILPAFRSEATIAGTLRALRAQSLPPSSVVVVDSSPDEATGEVVRAFPEVTLIRVGERLLPHAARNRGAAATSEDLLVFSDPDVYAEPEWLERLVAAWQVHRGPLVGGVGCHGRRWRDLGLHLAKYDQWLPGRPRGHDLLGPTANLLVPREIFDAVGGFPDAGMLGDTELSWRLAAQGWHLQGSPDAVVDHHHLQSLGQLARERFSRGHEFGRLRRGDWPRWRRGAMALTSLVPLRLTRLTARSARAAWAAGWGLRFAATWPVVVLGHAAWLAGEAVAYLGFDRVGDAR